MPTAARELSAHLLQKLNGEKEDPENLDSGFLSPTAHVLLACVKGLYHAPRSVARTSVVVCIAYV